MDDAVEDGRGLELSTYRSPSPMERVSWPVAPTTSFAAVTSAHVASLSVAVSLMGAKIQGTRLRLAMRFRHIRICSEAVRPPVIAGLHGRNCGQSMEPLEHVVGLAGLYNPVPFWQGLWLVWAGFSRGGGCSTNQPRLLGKRAVVITCQDQGVPVGDLLDAAAECLQQRSAIVHCFGR